MWTTGSRQQDMLGGNAKDESVLVSLAQTRMHEEKLRMHSKSFEVCFARFFQAQRCSNALVSIQI